jgi:hypothetical protein
MAKSPQNPKQALMVVRIIWAAMLIGQIVFLGVILAIRQNSAEKPQTPPILGYISVVMALAAVPTAFILRKAAYGRPDQQGLIPVGKYSTGNILFLAMLEGTALLGLVAFFLGNTIGIVASAGLMAVQLANFPCGGLIRADAA